MVGENRTLSAFLQRMIKKVAPKNKRIRKEIEDINFVKDTLDSTSSTLHSLRHVICSSYTCDKCEETFVRYEVGDIIKVNPNVTGKQGQLKKAKGKRKDIALAV